RELVNSPRAPVPAPKPISAPAARTGGVGAASGPPPAQLPPVARTPARNPFKLAVATTPPWVLALSKPGGAFLSTRARAAPVPFAAGRRGARGGRALARGRRGGGGGGAPGGP